MEENRTKRTYLALAVWHDKAAIGSCLPIRLPVNLDSVIIDIAFEL